MRNGLLALALGLFACGEPNATLTIALDPMPDRTSEESIVVTGAVTRSPAGDKPINVVAAGGRAVLNDSLVGTDIFSFSIRLNANVENQLVFSASDPTGAVADAVVVSIIHDNMPPAISSMTPPVQSVDVALDTPIEVFFQEALVAGPGAGIALLHNGDPVPGAATISPDARRITFTPSETLQPNSVYELELNGYADETGNPAGGNACFVTTPSPLTAFSESDTLDLGFFQGSPEATLVPIDVRTVRLTRQDSTLFGLLQFARPRRFVDGADSSGLAFIEIDADRNPATGVKPFRDSILTSFPELSTMMGVEYVIGLEPAVGDSAYLAVYTAPLQFDVVDAFRPGICGPYYGFHTTVLLDSLAEDGEFDYSVLAFSTGTQGNYADVMPVSGHFTVDLRGAAPTMAGPRSDFLRPPVHGVHGALDALRDRLAGIRRSR